MRRLALFDEFAVAVVDEDVARCGATRFDGRESPARTRRCRANGRGAYPRERCMKIVASPAARSAACDRLEIDAAVAAQRDFAVVDAVGDQRVRRIADRVAQRIVRAARRSRAAFRPGGVHAASAATMACVPLTIESRAIARSAPKHARQQRFVARARRIVVAVSGRAGEIALVEPFVEKRSQHVDVRRAPAPRSERRGARRSAAQRGIAHAPADAEPLAELRRSRVHADCDARVAFVRAHERIPDQRRDARC